MHTITASAMTPEAAKASGWPLKVPQTVYKRLEPPRGSEEQFNMTAFAITLNDPHDPCLALAPPTDSRHAALSPILSQTVMLF